MYRKIQKYKKKTQNNTIKYYTLTDSNTSITETYKSENKSTKFYLEFMLEKTIARR